VDVQISGCANKWICKCENELRIGCRVFLVETHSYNLHIYIFAHQLIISQNNF
jgi:hypothetical protein